MLSELAPSGALQLRWKVRRAADRDGVWAETPELELALSGKSNEELKRISRGGLRARNKRRRMQEQAEDAEVDAFMKSCSSDPATELLGTSAPEALRDALDVAGCFGKVTDLKFKFNAGDLAAVAVGAIEGKQTRHHQNLGQPLDVDWASRSRMLLHEDQRKIEHQKSEERPETQLFQIKALRLLWRWLDRVEDSQPPV